MTSDTWQKGKGSWGGLGSQVQKSRHSLGGRRAPRKAKVRKSKCRPRDWLGAQGRNPAEQGGGSHTGIGRDYAAGAKRKTLEADEHRRVVGLSETEQRGKDR